MYYTEIVELFNKSGPFFYNRYIQKPAGSKIIIKKVEKIYGRPG